MSALILYKILHLPIPIIFITFRLTRADSPAEQATAKAKDAIGVNAKKAEANAQELKGEAKGKASELQGKAKGTAEEIKGKM